MNFLDALSYPIRNSGWIMILIGAIFSAILDLFQFAPIFGLVVGVFGAGYFGAFYLDIVNATMTDHDEMPDWPSMSDFITDILSPFLRLTLLILISFTPLIALNFVPDPETPWFLYAVLVSVIYGCLYFPMGVLAAQSFGSVGAALPHIVLPAIFRTLPGYLLGVGALIFGFLMAGFAQNFSSEIPFIGWFFTAVIGLYSLMFQGRLIGLIYREKREALGWE